MTTSPEILNGSSEAGLPVDNPRELVGVTPGVDFELPGDNFVPTAETYAIELGCEFLDLSDDGLNNVVMLAPTVGAEPVAIFKSPKPGYQFRERSALEFIAGLRAANPPDLHLPDMLSTGDDPPHVLLSYVPGKTFNRHEQFSALNREEQLGLGRAVARFMIWESQLSTSEFHRDIDSVPGMKWIEWDAFFEQRLSLTERVSHLKGFSGLANRVRDLGRQYYPNGVAEQASMVIHGDLRIPNLIFNGEPGQLELTGIIDFETMRVGDMAEELRGLYMIGDACIEGCNDQLITDGYNPVDIDKVKFWCAARSVGWILSELAKPKRSHYILYMALSDLLRIYGDDQSKFDFEAAPDDMKGHFCKNNPCPEHGWTDFSAFGL